MAMDFNGNIRMQKIMELWLPNFLSLDFYTQMIDEMYR